MIVCDNCGGAFEQKLCIQRFCSNRCRQKFHYDERAAALKEMREMKKELVTNGEAK